MNTIHDEPEEGAPHTCAGIIGVGVITAGVSVLGAFLVVMLAPLESQAKRKRTQDNTDSRPAAPFRFLLARIMRMRSSAEPGSTFGPATVCIVSMVVSVFVHVRILSLPLPKAQTGG